MMKHLIILTVLFVLVIINQKNQQLFFAAAEFHNCPERTDSVRLTPESKRNSPEKTESPDSVKTYLSGKYYDIEFIVL